ncbi:MAG TPA: hypothetical protein DCO71_07700 [Gammaproteobacteria bacterium]|nr:hypothetical protein [Gammaproteobacteria bacterium]
MGRPFVADHAIVLGRDTRTEMTPVAVPVAPPVAPVCARGGLGVAAHAVVLPMAGEAALAVAGRHEAVAQRAPGMVVIAGLDGIVALDAVVALVAGITGPSVLS